jgi:hypothetical protein
MNIICKSVFSSLLLVVLAGCMSQAPVKSVAKEPEQLIVYADGTMEFRNRKIDSENVVIYGDGRGGEKAAVKISLEPLHPPFYRDTIVVVRKPSDS